MFLSSYPFASMNSLATKRLPRAASKPKSAASLVALTPAVQINVCVGMDEPSFNLMWSAATSTIGAFKTNSTF